MNRVARRLVLTASLLAATPCAAAPQDLVPPGAPIRITAPSVGLVNHQGRLEAVTADVIQVDGLLIARDAITRVEVLQGVSNFLRYTGVGLLTGVALGVTACLIDCSEDSEISKGGFMFGYGMLGGVSGLVLGAIVGGATERTEWRSVPESSLRPIVTRTPDGRLGLGFRVRT